jgi:hypothetical protein
VQNTLIVTYPVEFAGVLKGAGRSGAFSVRYGEDSTGGLQDEELRGAP